MSQRQLLIFAAVAAVCLAGAAGWWLLHGRPPADTLTLYGNVDLRQVELAFNDADRIAAVNVQEGDRLAKGEVLARLDVSRLGPELAQAQAQADAQRAVVDKMHAGNRPQEIDQSHSMMSAAEADALVASSQYQRASRLWGAADGQAAVSRQDVDNAKAAMDSADAKLAAQRKAYELETIGPRREDIAQAVAQLQADEAQVAVLKRELADADLVSPVVGVVRSRLMEPGEMASPQRPVFAIAETDPKWVRDLCERGRPGEGPSGHGRRGDGRRVSRTRLQGLGRVHLFGSRVHPQAGRDHRTAHKPRLRGARLRHRSRRRPSARDAGDGRLAACGREGRRMSDIAKPVAVVSAVGLGKRFAANKQAFAALTDVTVAAQGGAITALVGSDGAGKTTLMRLIAGLLVADAGVMTVLGFDAAKDPQAIQSRIGYMPQRFGLYDDLSVKENLDLYADLHGVTPAQRRAKYPGLMEMTALAPFMGRLAGQLSGGMKQKLGLACTLVSTPQLLLLDEPTAGVDPLSRRELWEIIRGLVKSEGLPVVVSTSYLDEADRCDQVVILNQGKALAQGEPGTVSRIAEGRTFLLDVAPGVTARESQAQLLSMDEVVDAVPEAGRVRLVLTSAAAAHAVAARAGAELHPTTAHFEDGFMALLRSSGANPMVASFADPTPTAPRPRPSDPTPEVAVRNLVRRFGAFTAVDNISFEVGRGQIFGLLGPNGAGQDHDLSHALRPPAGQRRRTPRRRCQHAPRAGVGEGAAGLCGAEILALRPVVGGGKPRLLRQRLWPARRAQALAHRLGAEGVRARTLRDFAERRAGRRLQAEAGDGRGAAARA